MAAVIPIVEIADQADQPGIGCPDGEMRAMCALVP